MGIGMVLIALLILVAVGGVLWALIGGLSQKDKPLDQPPQEVKVESPPDPALHQQPKGADKS